MKGKTKTKADAGPETNGVKHPKLEDVPVGPPKTPDELEMEALIEEFRGSNENLEVALGSMLEIDAALEQLQDQVKELNRSYAIAEKGIIGMMMDQGIPKFQALGKTVTIKTTEQASVLKEDREAQFTWMRKAGFGDLIVETCFPATFSRFVRDEFIEPGKENELPPFVRIYKDEKLYIRKAGAAATANENKLKAGGK